MPASRLGFGRFPVALVLLGCIVPDLPWILRRSIVGLNISVDQYALMQYVIVQASLLFCLVFCAAVACLTRRWALTGAVLAVNAFLHLLIDTVEIKVGNGVHLLAPWSWELFSFALIWPEHMLVTLLTVIGLGIGAWLLVSAPADLGLADHRMARRVGLGGLLMAAYLLAPLALLQGPYDADVRSVKTLREAGERVGRTVRFDRRPYVKSEDGAYIVTFAGEKLQLVGESLPPSGHASVTGVFADEQTVQVQQIRQSEASLRDLASYIGLFVIAVVWVRAGWLSLLHRRGH